MSAAMVTGGAQGIGLATARRLAARGHQIVIADPDEGALSRAAASLRGDAVDVTTYACDVRDRVRLLDIVDEVEREVGPLAVQVNSAGVFRASSLLDLDPEEWDLVMDVNAKGVLFSMQAAARAMLPRGRGRIVNVSSLAGRGSRPLWAAYAASKAAVISLTRSAAAAWGPSGLRINAVAPGVVETLMQKQLQRERLRLGGGQSHLPRESPVGRTASPEDISAVISVLLAGEADFINGQTLNACGGIEMD